MEIKVCSRHIKKGEQDSATGCAIALAIKDMLGVTYVEVNKDDVYIGESRFELPLEAQEFIDLFDEAKSKAKPFSFEL